MEILNVKRCRKPENQLTREYQQKLRRLREIARRERESLAGNDNFPSSTEHSLVVSHADHFNGIDPYHEDCERGIDGEHWWTEYG